MVCNTIIGCLLEQDKRQEKLNHSNHTHIRVRPVSRSETNTKIVDYIGSRKKTTNFKEIADITNTIAKWFFAISVLVFNAAFWAYSVSQYVR